MREWCSAAALVLMMLARADATSSNSFRQHEGHFQGDLVADHLCVVDGGLLVLHPAALDVLQRLVGAVDTLHDCILGQLVFDEAVLASAR